MWQLGNGATLAGPAQCSYPEFKMPRHWGRIPVLPALTVLLLGSAPGLCAQGLAVREMTVALRIPALFALESEVLPGSTVRQGAYAVADGATRLYVSGNESWVLLAEGGTSVSLGVRVSSRTAGVQVGAGGVGIAADAAQADGADAAGFVEVGSATEVARGPRGNRMALLMDYRWQGVGGPPRVLYTVVAD